MSLKMTINAPAKINLHLAIGSRRGDGYHPVASLFQAISLSDELSIEASDQPGIHLECDVGCAPSENTAYKAARAFMAEASLSRVDLPPGLTIAIEKRVPSQAGLGGGSSDAAATLKLLSAAFPGALPPERVEAIAAGIGSDVPFFLASPCALVRGRGEELEPVQSRDDYTLLIVDPGFGISTRLAYAALDEFRSSRSIPVERDSDSMESSLQRAISSYRDAPPKAWDASNDFFECLAGMYPELGEAKASLERAGAEFAAMSGSGSCLFGVFGHADAAERARARLATRYHAIVTMPLSAFPLAR